jgi:hypothetical protein
MRDRQSFRSILNRMIEERILDPIAEAAARRSVAHTNIRELQYVVSEHLLKYFFLPNNQSLNHWRRELETWRRRIMILNKGKNPSGVNLSRSKIKQIFWDEPFSDDGDVQHVASMIRQDGYDLPTDEELEEQRDAFKNFVISYVDSIFDLSKKPNY